MIEIEAWPASSLTTFTGRPEAIHIEIEDDGPGLGPTENLFTPFYTTKPGGSGIGLVLARQIAEAHGGALTLESRDGASGCIAHLMLPLAAEA